MGYQTKYRLDFSDVDGNPYRLEILKKDYLSTQVFPLIGGKDPIKISWQSSDDFYKPIIGSKCTIQLLETETTNYDEFYKFDEREYKINVYYGKSIATSFEERVFSNDTIIESLGCVDDVLNFNSFYSSFANRVNQDLGVMEDDLCWKSQLTDYNIVDYDLYWTGFMVVDRYKEKLQAKPYKIQLNAFDGLGTLNDFDAPYYQTFDQQNDLGALIDIQRIYNIIDDLDLEIPIAFQQDIGTINLFGLNYPAPQPFPQRFPYHGSAFGPDSEFDSKFNNYSSKKTLEAIFTLNNMRIFQSFGKFYVTQHSNLFDISLKDEIRNEVSTSNPTTIPTDIRDKITLLTQQQNNERFLTEVFSGDNNTGAYLPISLTNDYVSISAPERLIPLSKNLQAEYLQPLDKVTIKWKRGDTIFPFYNSGFEYNQELAGTIIPNQYVQFNTITTLMTQENPRSGNWSVRVQPSFDVTAPNPLTMFRIPKIGTFSFPAGDLRPKVIDDISDYGWKMSVYNKFDTNNTQVGGTIYINFRVSMSISWSGPTTYTTDYYYWNQVDKKWDLSTSTSNTYVLMTAINEYQDIKVKFSAQGIIRRDNQEDAQGNLSNIGLIGITPFLMSPQCNDVDYNTTFYDNIVLSVPERVNPPDIEKTYITKINSPGIKTTKKEFKIDFGISLYPKYRARDNDIGTGFFPIGSLWKDPILLKSQVIANDYREFVTRYDGNFKNKNKKPIGFHNKVWIDYGNLLQEKQSSIIDGMTFNVKQNNYKIKAHVPNDDDDVAVTTDVQ